MKRTILAAALVLVAAATALPRTVAAATKTEDADNLVVESGKTIENFTADPNLTWFREHIKDAKGLLICSKVVKAGFVFGGSGGRCVFVARDEHGWWNGPAFYTTGTASVGFQAGVDVAEIVSLAMTQKAVDSLMSSEFKLGGNISATAGPVGAGAGANPSSDFLVYSRSKGLFGGVDVSGAVIKPSADYNKAYYGKPVTPIDIIVKGSAHKEQADATLLWKVEKMYEQLSGKQ